MEISFKTQGDVQIVEIDGVMGDSEAAAIRVKLEQKINQGRAKVLFDLGNFPMENDSARNLLIGIISYSINRGTVIACAGVRSSQRPLLIMPGPKQVKIFFTRTEGLDYLQKTAQANPKAALGGKRTEEQIKEEALQKLLERYEVFQNHDDEDPFRLQFLIEQFNATPNREALIIEKKAMDGLKVIHDEIQILEGKCDELAKQVKALTQYRKTPLSSKELQLKQEKLEKDFETVDQAIAKLNLEKSENLKAIELAKNSVLETRKASEEAISELENYLKSTGESFTKEAADLQSQDAQEQAHFEARLNAPK